MIKEKECYLELSADKQWLRVFVDGIQITCEQFKQRKIMHESKNIIPRIPHK